MSGHGARSGAGARAAESRWLARALVVTTGVAAVTFWLAYDGGTYGEVSRGTVAVAVWWALAVLVATGFLPAAGKQQSVAKPQRIPRALVVATASLAGLAAVTLASTVWADSAEKAFAEFNRVALYVGVVLLVGLAATREALGRWVDGIALGITATGLLALASRLFPEVISSGDALRFLPSALARLSFPLDYWNGLAIFLALAFPLLLRTALVARPAFGALAVAALPALAAAIYLTSSRGGVASTLLGTTAFLVLADRRLQAVGVAALAAVGCAVAVVVVASRRELVNQPETSEAIAQGRSAALLIAVACVLTAAAYVLAQRYLPGRIPPFGRRIGPLSRRIALIAVAVLALAGIAAANPMERFERFKAPPPPAQVRTAEEDPLQAHLLSGGSSGRWQQWETALDEFASAPVVGRGAGSYEAWWAQHGSLPGFNKDAHSLYVEMLGELGIVGFVFLLLAFGTGLVAGFERVVRARANERTTVAAIFAGFVAYAFAAGIDWMWEMTVVSVVGMAFLALLTGGATVTRATRSRSRMASPWVARGVRVAVLALGVVVIGAQAVALLSRVQIEESQAAVRRGDSGTAVDEALAARQLEPWAASPYLHLALVEESSGDLAGARTWIEEALERDPADWRLWLTAARIQTKAGAVADGMASLERARELNPRSPLFARERAT